MVDNIVNNILGNKTKYPTFYPNKQGKLNNHKCISHGDVKHNLITALHKLPDVTRAHGMITVRLKGGQTKTLMFKYK